MAVAMKYALLQVFCIPTEEMKDPDGETPPETVPNEKSSGQTQTEYIDAIKQGCITTELKRSGYSVNSVLRLIEKEFTENVPTALSKITEPQFAYVIKKLEKLPDKPQKKDPLA